MSIVLELRGHVKHSVTQLVHPTSEDVVLSNVFGIVKNLPTDLVLSPWLREVTGLPVPDSGWSFCFWQRQPRPIGIREGNTVVDLVIESDSTLIFAEVKMDAPASPGPLDNPDRNQLVRNLDVGYRRAADRGKHFILIFLTPDITEPPLVTALRLGTGPFPANPDVSASRILSCLYWASWATIGDAIAAAYSRLQLRESEAAFARDLLAYLAKKRLWGNQLPDEPLFYSDKLYRSLQRKDSPFIPYAQRRPERYDGWRVNAWDQNALASLLGSLRLEDQALLKVLADAGGIMRQDQLISCLPMLRGKTGASLRALKAHINRQCKQLDRAPLLSEGDGTGPSSRHEINPLLGPLRDMVIATARRFNVNWELLESPSATAESSSAGPGLVPTVANAGAIKGNRTRRQSETGFWVQTGPRVTVPSALRWISQGHDLLLINRDALDANEFSSLLDAFEKSVPSRKNARVVASLRGWAADSRSALPLRECQSLLRWVITSSWNNAVPFAEKIWAHLFGRPAPTWQTWSGRKYEFDVEGWKCWYGSLSH